MHPYKKPTPEEWATWMDAVEAILGRELISRDLPGDVYDVVTLFHASMVACGEGASPQAFANVIKGRI